MALTSYELFATLTDHDPQIRRTVWHALDDSLDELETIPIAYALMRVLDDETLAYAWPDCREMLDRSRRPEQVFEHHLLVGLTERPDGGLATLLGARPELADVAPDADADIRVLLSLLASPVDWAHACAVRELAVRPAAAPALRALRRRPGTPGRARYAALRTLAEIDWAELDERDQALLRRLVAVKRHTEEPESVELEASWYAIATTDRDAVLEAFDLCEPVPVTLRGGFAPWLLPGDPRPMNYAGHELAEPDRFMPFHQVFVTPALAGWTLVVSEVGLLYRTFGEAYERCAELSRRFGTAHWYGQSYGSGCGDFSGWCIAEQGELKAWCYYDNYDHLADDPDTGPAIGGEGQRPTVAELRRVLDAYDDGSGNAPELPAFTREVAAGLLAEAFGNDAVRLTSTGAWEAPTDPWELSAERVAGRISVDPRDLGPDTRVEGGGLLAVPRSQRHRRRFGSLPL